jgi:triosephosphate isomerase
VNSPLVIGNWKMHGTPPECLKLASDIIGGLEETGTRASVVLAPPAPALMPIKQIRGNKISLAGQNCHWEESGAFTGEVSAPMLRESGCEFVIIGHSERRHIFKETDETIARKVQAGLRNGLRPILCVGETLTERRRDLTARVISRQLRIALKGVAETAIGQIEVAYEPVWAIGTGQNATSDQITEVHDQIRRFLVKSFGAGNANSIRILYGGSVKPENAATLARTREVQGLLVGGASLKAETFLPIVRCF